MNSNIDGFIKTLSFVLRLDRVTDYRAIRHDPAVQDVAVGQGNDANGDMVVWLFHEILQSLVRRG